MRTLGQLLRDEGRQEGRRELWQEGLQEGERKKALAIAQNLLNTGLFGVDTIKEITGLSDLSELT